MTTPIGRTRSCVHVETVLPFLRGVIVKNTSIIVAAVVLITAGQASSQVRKRDGIYRHPERLGIHWIQTDEANNLLPWYSKNLGQSYDYALGLVWNRWKNISEIQPGVKYYMAHRTLPWTDTFYGNMWNGPDDGIGGDQIQMCLSSWAKYYAYTGDRSIIDNMTYMADFYLDRGLSKSDCNWPNLPYPWNSTSKPGFRYDGDLRHGINVTQLDKAGDFGYQLVNLYKITGTKKYLDAAVRIADTLAARTAQGDINTSPLPYKVNTETGKVVWPYTSNWTWTVEMFNELAKMNVGNTAGYKQASDRFIEWFRNVPIKQNKYGPFFEDIDVWSDAGINAGRLAFFILNHPDKWGDSWQQDARRPLDWMVRELGNHQWEKYGVVVTNEQTAYRYEGNSHSSRHASLEILYSQKTGDWSRKANSIRELSWATYSVDYDGRNEYPGDPVDEEIWFTDGYGDYVEHYLNAMAALPEELAPDNGNHLLHSTSIIKKIAYQPTSIKYVTYDKSSTELLRLTARPARITAGGKPLNQKDSPDADGWTWKPLDKGGVLQIKHSESNKCSINLETTAGDK